MIIQDPRIFFFGNGGGYQGRHILSGADKEDVISFHIHGLIRIVKCHQYGNTILPVLKVGDMVVLSLLAGPVQITLRSKIPAGSISAVSGTGKVGIRIRSVPWKGCAVQCFRKGVL